MPPPSRSTTTSSGVSVARSPNDPEIMPTIQTLTDLYGPRLTGSPNLRHAQDWIVQQTTTWGLKNAHLEAWDFGHPGWQNERATMHLVSPVTDPLVVEVLAWTPGTPGTVTAQTVLVEPPQRPVQADLETFFAAWRGKLKGRAVMIGQPVRQDVAFQTPAKRRTMQRCGRGSRADAAPIPVPPPSPAAPATDKPRPLTADQVAEQINALLRSPKAPPCASTTAVVSTARFAPSTIGRSTWPRPSRRSSCATRTTAASRG